jgi:hypothetical protein
MRVRITSVTRVWRSGCRWPAHRADRLVRGPPHLAEPHRSGGVIPGLQRRRPALGGMPSGCLPARGCTTAGGCPLRRGPAARSPRRLRAGNGQVVLVESAVAHGKTELLRTFSKRAVSAGSLCLNASCSRVESAFPMGVLSQLFHNVDMPPGLREQVAGLLDSGTSISISGNDAAGVVEPAMAHVFHGIFRDPYRSRL